MSYIPPLPSIFAALAADAALAGVTQMLGSQHIADQGAPPRIVWAPSLDRYSSPDQSLPDTGQPRAIGDDALAPRALFTRGAGCELHFWAQGITAGKPDPAQDHAAMVQLVDRWVRAMWAQCSGGAGSFELEGGTWGIDTPTKMGVSYVLAVRFKTPLLELDLPSVVEPTAMQVDVEVDTP